MKRQLTSLAVLWMVCGIARAVVPDVPESALTCLRELDSNSIQAREKASETLRAWGAGSPERLLSLISPQCSPEQRERLLSLAHESFKNSPRSAMGVSFGPRWQGLGNAEEIYEEGIPIEGTTRGFDSANVLKPGDILRSVDGVRVRTHIQCRIQTMSHDPRQTVRLEIERDGRPMMVNLVLGYWMDLRSPDSPSAELVQAAWKARLARCLPAVPEDTHAIQPLPGALAWVEGDRLTPEAPGAPAMNRGVNLRARPDLQPDQIIPLGPQGGSQLNMDRSDSPAADLVASGTPREKISTATSPGRLVARTTPGALDLQDNRAAEQLLRLKVTELQQRIVRNNDLLISPDLTVEQRRQARDELEDLQIQISALRDQIAQLRAMRDVKRTR